MKKVKPQKPKATKPPKVVSQRGWRHWVHALTRINLGLSPDEKYELDLHARVRRNPRGSYQIAVVGLKGGAGKTTLTAALGSTLAQVRADRILALDADPGAGNLADRVGRQSGATIADVLAEKELSHYNDIRAHTSVNAVNLEVLPAPEYSSAQRALSDADWHFIADPASRFYNLVLADCGAGFFDPLTRGVLSTVSGVVVVASVSIDGAQQASVALDWLRNNGYQDLASRACVVINHIMPGEPNVAVKDLVRHFEQQVQPAGSWSCRGTGTLRPEPRFHSTCSTLSTSARSSNWPQRYPTISRGLDVVERTCCCCWSYRRGGNRCAACHHPGDDPDRQTDDRFGTASGGADGHLY